MRNGATPDWHIADWQLGDLKMLLFKKKKKKTAREGKGSWNWDMASAIVKMRGINERETNIDVRRPAPVSTEEASIYPRL